MDAHVAIEPKIEDMLKTFEAECPIHNNIYVSTNRAIRNINSSLKSAINEYSKACLIFSYSTFKAVFD